MTRHSKQLFASLLTNVRTDERGAAALMVFLIMLAAAVIVVSTSALIGVDVLTSGFSQQTSSDMILSAETCVEEAMIRLRRNNSYGGGSLAVGDAQCTINVTGTPCGACTIDVEAVGDSFTRNIEATVNVSGSSVDILTWEEQP